MFTIQGLISHRLVVVLSSYDAIHDALIKRAGDFSDRPHIHYFGNEILNKEAKGIAIKKILIIKNRLNHYKMIIP